MKLPSWRGMGGFAVAAAAAVGLLSHLSQAPHQGARLEKLQTQALATPRNPTRPNLPVTLCRAPLASAVALATSGLKRRAAEAGLMVEALRFEPLDELPPAGVEGAKLALKVSGDEAGLTRFLKASAAAQESLFIDRGDIAVGGRGVEAEFQGRLLCRHGL